MNKILPTGAEVIEWDDIDSPVNAMPCPFCGKTASLSYWGGDLAEDEYRGCSGFVQIVCSVHDNGCGASSGYADGRAAAVTKWNSRHKEA